MKKIFFLGILLINILCSLNIPFAAVADEVTISAPAGEAENSESGDMPLFAQNNIPDDDQDMPEPPRMFNKKFDAPPDKSKLKVMLIWKLTKELSLDEQTAAKFFPMYNSYMDKRDKILDKQRELVTKISEDADNESVPVATIKAKVNEFTENENTLLKEKTDLFKKAEPILNDRQYMKLVIFEEKLRMDVFERFQGKGRDGKDQGKQFSPTPLKKN